MAGVGRRSVAIVRVTVRPTLVRPSNAAVPGAPGPERSAGQALEIVFKKAARKSKGA